MGNCLLEYINTCIYILHRHRTMYLKIQEEAEALTGSNTDTLGVNRDKPSAPHVNIGTRVLQISSIISKPWAMHFF